MIVNGVESNRLELHRGPRQGDPLSPLTFALAIEPLDVKIIENDNVTGMTTSNRQHKINLYADDMLLFLENPLKSIKLRQVLERFNQETGLKKQLSKI